MASLPTRKPLVPCLLALLLLAACSGDVTPRHLVVVSIDTLRADRVGAYGGEGGLTPNLDRLAKSGVRFEDAIVQSIATPPSHASIFTGLNPASHGLRKVVGQRLAADNTTLAEWLRARGFYTAAFVSAVPLRRALGLDQGFDLYDDWLPHGIRERRAEATNRRVREWLAGRPVDQRLFLWVHYFDPHHPYAAPRAHRLRAGARDAAPGELPAPVNANPVDAPRSRSQRWQATEAASQPSGSASTRAASLRVDDQGRHEAVKVLFDRF